MPIAQKKPVDEYRFRRARGLVFQHELRDFAKFLAKKFGFKVAVDGLDIQEIEGGVLISGGGGGGADTTGYPFKMRSGFDSGHWIFQFGQVGGVTPTVAGIPIGDDPPPQCSIVSGEVPYLKINMTPSITNRGTVGSPDWWITGAAVDSAQIAAVSTPPTGVPASVVRATGVVTSGEYYRQIAAFSAGRWENAIRFSLEAKLCDDSSGNGTLTLGVAG